MASESAQQLLELNSNLSGFLNQNESLSATILFHVINKFTTIIRHIVTESTGILVTNS